jgi:hypothetical protein
MRRDNDYLSVDAADRSENVELPKPILGTAHGDRIELDEPLGFDDGQRIVVEIKSTVDDADSQHAVRQLGGALADLPVTVDEHLHEILAARKDSSFREIDS